MLVVEGVRKAFGQRLALDNVTLTVEAGRFVALLGPNGAGKTTLFQLMTGLFTGDGGRIEIAGHDIDRDPVAALANVGIVFQEPTLDLDLTAEANLLFHARLHGLAPGRAREGIAEQAARLGIADRLTDRVRSLSGGNRRRVELARALLHEPPLLLMDEPTVGLDPASRRDLLANVLALKEQRDTAVLWATHLVDEAERADTVVVLHLGEVLFTGPPAALSERTASTSLADAFIALTGG